MDPLNKQERTEAIIKVLAFFILALVVVAVPMYYAFRLPEKEDNMIKVRNEAMAMELTEIEQFESEFLMKTDSAIALFDAFVREEDELTRDKIQLRYSNTTNQMEDELDKIENDTLRLRLYDNIIYTYNNLFRIWDEKNELQEQLDDCLKRSRNQSAEISEKSRIVREESEKTIKEKEIDLINKALEKHNGNKRQAAKELGTTERKLRKRMKELGIG